MIYIIEFARPLGTEKHQARYYIGWCADYPGALENRIAYHRKGMGAAITRAAYERGIEMSVIVTLPGTKEDERRLKNQKNTPRLVKKLLKGAPNGHAYSCL